MSRFTKQTASYWKQLGSVVRNEFRTIFKDGGVMLILIFALIIYATAYSLAYGSQVLRNVPIGVVDECRTPTSRSLIDTFNAGPNTYVAYNPTSMEEAKELFYGRKIYGVVYIPSDYGEKLYGGVNAPETTLIASDSVADAGSRNPALALWLPETGKKFREGCFPIWSRS